MLQQLLNMFATSQIYGNNVKYLQLLLTIKNYYFLYELHYYAPAGDKYLLIDQDP